MNFFIFQQYLGENQLHFDETIMTDLY